jgi:ABC-2 type transport system ATP-binding protein
MPLLECRSVYRGFGRGRRRRTALAACTFAAEPGEIVGVVGPNGAGKTTLFRAIAGDVALTSGDILVGGRRAGTLAARQAVGLAPDPPNAPPELTGLEWLTYLASHRAPSVAARDRLTGWAIGFADLAEFVGRRIATYSRGMAQRLALGAAAIAGDRILVLDETLNAIDPLVQRRLRVHLADLAATGRLVLVASHDLGTLERIATRVIVLAGGRVRADVSTAALVRERVAELTLTGSALAGIGRLLERFRGASRTGHGIAVPLVGGLTVEQVLAVCRQDRVPVAASRVRYRILEDILVAAMSVEELVA